MKTSALRAAPRQLGRTILRRVFDQAHAKQLRPHALPARRREAPDRTEPARS